MRIEELNKLIAKKTHNSLCEKLYERSKPSFVSNQYALTHFSISTEQEIAFCSLFKGKKDELHIGNFESLNDASAVQSLLESIELYGINNGFSKLIGPIHGSTFYPYRFTDSFNTPFSSEYIHREYYPSLFKTVGFRIDQTYYSTISPIKEVESPNKLTNLFPNLERINTIDESKFLDDVYQFVNQNFQYNPLYQPVNKSEFDEIYRPILKYLIFPFCQIIYDQGKIVGLFFAFRDQSKNTFVVKSLARDLNEKYKGLTAVMCDYFVNQAVDHGIEFQIHAYFHENSLSKYVSQKYGGKAYKTHHLFAKKL